MYHDFFGLNAAPFKITPDPQLFYSGGHRGLALEALVYAIVHGEGIVKVVGEVGSGKTMLCRMLEHNLPATIEIVYLANPSLSPDLILHAIAFEMGLPIQADSSRLVVMHSLQQALLEKHANHRQVVVFVEEAQGMPLATLEEIRLLSNLETAHHKLLQIVLFGQPELDQQLAIASIRQLKERITHAIYLAPLSRADIEHYLHFRMQSVGYRGPPIFTKAAVQQLQYYSCGLMRRINILADKALLAAYANNQHYVQPAHIRLAAQDSGFQVKTRQQLAQHGLLAVLILGLIGGVLWLSPHSEQLQHWLTHTFSALKPAPVPTTTAKPPDPSPETPITPPPIAPTAMPDPVSSNPSAPDFILSLTAAEIEALSEPLQSRVRATQTWLKTQVLHSYVIQVLQVPTENSVAVARLLQQAELNSLLPYLYVIEQNAHWNLLYGAFPDEPSAQIAMAALPPILQNNRPYLRRLASFQPVTTESHRPNE